MPKKKRDKKQWEKLFLVHLSQLIHPMGGVRANPFSSPSTPCVPIISKITRGCILGKSIPETSSRFIIKQMLMHNAYTLKVLKVNLYRLGGICSFCLRELCTLWLSWCLGQWLEEAGTCFSGQPLNILLLEMSNQAEKILTGYFVVMQHFSQQSCAAIIWLCLHKIILQKFWIQMEFKWQQTADRCWEQWLEDLKN